MNNLVPGKAAIVGIGQTEFSKDSKRSEMKLAIEAVSAALKDAGLTGADVDGLSTFTMDNNQEMMVARLIGSPGLKMFSRVDYGGGAACGPLAHAAQAVAAGVCECVVIYRAFNERSGARFGTGELFGQHHLNPVTIQMGNYLPHGLMTPASWFGMTARRYMHEYGYTSEDWGRVSVSLRDFAATNPNSTFYGKPITLDDHQNSRMVCDPLRLLDCCQETDGAVAAVITSVERAKTLEQDPVVIEAATQMSLPTSDMMTNFYLDDMAGVPEGAAMAKELFAQSGLNTKHLSAAMFYDHFSPAIPIQMEEWGICGRGEAKELVKDGYISRGGTLPVNTHGGMIGEAYLHGVNGILEAVRQIRGQSCNQIEDPEHILVTAGAGIPSGAAILGRADN